MKRNRFLLIAFMAIMLCACSSDDDNNDNGTNFLYGTTWVSEGEIQDFTFKFDKNTAKFIYTLDENGDGRFDADESRVEKVVRYALDENYIAIIDKREISTGIISGNKLILNSSGRTIRFYKQ